MIEKLEAYIEANPQPKWVHLHRKNDGLELEMEGRTSLAIIFLVLMICFLVFSLGVVFLTSNPATDENLDSLPGLGVIAFILGFHLFGIGLGIYHWKKSLKKIVLFVDDLSDEFKLFYRSRSGVDDAPMSFDRWSFVAVLRLVTQGQHSYYRLEVYPDAEASQKDPPSWTKKPTAPCFMVNNWNKERCEWFVNLLETFQCSEE